MKILIATTNPGKMAELEAILDMDIEWFSLADFPDTKEVAEDGKTFAENARKKAIQYARQTGLWTLADDSGLVIDALDGAPGVNSARFSGKKELNRNLLDYKNMEKALKMLKGVPLEKRTARFVCNLCLASSEEVLIETQGSLEGVITTTPTGKNGFGYDPIFFVPSLGKTVAQLKSRDKNRISHRSQAISRFKKMLTQL